MLFLLAKNNISLTKAVLKRSNYAPASMLPAGWFSPSMLPADQVCSQQGKYAPAGGFYCVFGRFC